MDFSELGLEKAFRDLEPLSARSSSVAEAPAPVEVWDSAYSVEHQRPYYFNLASGAVQWERPRGVRLVSASAGAALIEPLLKLGRRGECILQFLRPREVKAWHQASDLCRTFCGGASDKRQLLVPTYAYNRQTVRHVDMESVSIFTADDAQIVNSADHTIFEEALTACARGGRLQHLLCAHNPKLNPSCLARAVRPFAALLSLDLAFNALARDPDESLHAFFAALPPSLKLLDLSHNLLQDKHTVELARCLNENGHGCLEELMLRSNKLGDGAGLGLGSILEARAGSALRRLDLRGNRVGSQGACHMLRALVQHRRMRDLRIGYNTASRELDKITAAHADAVLRSPSSVLARLDLSNVRLGDDGAATVGWALLHNRVLRRLDVAFNCIGVPGTEAMMEAVSDNRALEVLDFRDNEVGDHGAVAVAKMLRRNWALRHLLISRCGITDAGGQHIVAALREPPPLRFVRGLDIAGNPLSSQVRRNIMHPEGLFA